jgi:1-acyl-sn-glycerol-3-phosphate acyltransferase
LNTTKTCWLELDVDRSGLSGVFSMTFQITVWQEPHLAFHSRSPAHLAWSFTKMAPWLMAGNRSRFMPWQEQPAALRHACTGLSQALGTNLEITGLEHIRDAQNQGPFVVLPLHEGHLDFVSLFQLPIPLRFVARLETMRWPVIGPIMRDSGSIEVSPERGLSSYRAMLRQAKPIFDRGESLVVFPQGSICGLEIDFQPGAFRLAKHYGLPILPVVLSGSHSIWDFPFNPFLHGRGRVCMEILEPIPASQVSADPEAVRVGLKRRMKARALEADFAPPRRYDPDRDGYWDGYLLEIDPDFEELYAKIAAHRAKHGVLPDGRFADGRQPGIAEKFFHGLTGTPG